MARANVEIARGIFDGWEAGDFRATVSDLAPHAVIVVPPYFLEHGVFVGTAGIEEFTRRFLEQYERVAIKARRFREDGDTVLVDVIQFGIGRASGIEMEIAYFMLFTFRGGKIVRMESVPEEDEALRAAGLSQ